MYNSTILGKITRGREAVFTRTSISVSFSHVPSMKLTIFSRLVIGYLAIFIFTLAVNVYAIIQLRHLESVTKSMLRVDNRFNDLEQKLTDLFLSALRYEKKFILIKDNVFYDYFLLAKKDYEIVLREMISIASTDRLKDLLTKLQKHSVYYRSIIDKEMMLIKSGKTYAQDSYEREKEESINEITLSLKKLRALNQQNTYNKIKELDEAEVNAIKVAMSMTVVSLVFLIIISIFITVNITKPLSTIKKKTREIASGDFECDLKLTSPPEIRELAQAFNSMCMKLKAVDKMKSDFFSLMSHELRTPLTSIKEGTNLLLEGLQKDKTADKQKRILQIITEESNRLIDLVNSLLDISRMEAGMTKYHFSRKDIAPLITKVIRELEPIAETRNISLGTGVAGALPIVFIDSERILQVLRNLIGNAIKFTPDGGSVLVRAASEEKGIRLSIEDTGIGIPEEDLTSIFFKFHQAILSGQGKIKGTGLGLSLVKHIVQAHGGKVWAESTEGKGSTFTFILPA
jgi:two-component system sensor histidine kinase GlrK